MSKQTSHINFSTINFMTDYCPKCGSGFSVAYLDLTLEKVSLCLNCGYGLPTDLIVCTKVGPVWLRGYQSMNPVAYLDETAKIPSVVDTELKKIKRFYPEINTSYVRAEVSRINFLRPHVVPSKNILYYGRTEDKKSFEAGYPHLPGSTLTEEMFISGNCSREVWCIGVYKIKKLQGLLVIWTIRPRLASIGLTGNSNVPFLSVIPLINSYCFSKGISHLNIKSKGNTTTGKSSIFALDPFNEDIKRQPNTAYISVTQSRVLFSLISIRGCKTFSMTREYLRHLSETARHNKPKGVISVSEQGPVLRIYCGSTESNICISYRGCFTYTGTKEDLSPSINCLVDIIRSSVSHHNFISAFRYCREILNPEWILGCPKKSQ